jgi:hypothetical protein
MQSVTIDNRKRCGEELKDKSPLFRKGFNKDNPFTINSPRFISYQMCMYAVEQALKRSVVKTGEAMRSRAFRKGFMSTCEPSGMRSINVKMLLGHDIDVSGHYYRPTESDVLEDFMTHAADELTINPEYRLRRENQELESQVQEEMNRMKTQVNEIMELVVLLRDKQGRILDRAERQTKENKKLKD